MKYRIKKNKRFRKRYYCREESKIIYKYIYNNRQLCILNRLRVQNKLDNLLLTKGIAYNKNFCVLTGRSNGMVTEFGVSRIKLRELFSMGKVYGVRKASW